jgi:hypothetical protein
MAQRKKASDAYAAEAEGLPDNRWLRAFFDEHEAELTGAWKAAPSVEERERLHAQVRALNDFKGSLYAAAKRTKPE